MGRIELNKRIDALRKGEHWISVNEILRWSNCDWEKKVVHSVHSEMGERERGDSYQLERPSSLSKREAKT